MGNIGRSSTGCALCRKRKIKVGSTIDFRHQMLPYLLSNSVTRENLVANGALKYASLVQAILSKFNYRYARLRTVRQKDQTVPPFFLGLSSLQTIRPRHYQNSFLMKSNLTKSNSNPPLTKRPSIRSLHLTAQFRPRPVTIYITNHYASS